MSGVWESSWCLKEIGKARLLELWECDRQLLELICIRVKSNNFSVVDDSYWLTISNSWLRSDRFRKIATVILWLRHYWNIWWLITLLYNPRNRYEPTHSYSSKKHWQLICKWCIHKLLTNIGPNSTYFSWIKWYHFIIKPSLRFSKLNLKWEPN